MKSLYRFKEGVEYHYCWGYWCVNTKMEFLVEGVKSKPYSEYLSEIDLLTDSKKSIRARQRQKITTLKIGSWVNRRIRSGGGQRYTRATIELFPFVFAN